MKFYVFHDQFIEVLKSADDKVADNNQGKRIYIGPVLTRSNADYLAPLSSPKDHHSHLSGSDIRFLKMSEQGKEARPLGVIRICNMIPAARDAYELLDVDAQESHYRRLLQMQIRFIVGKQDIIRERASILYGRVAEGRPPDVVESCCKFLNLETAVRQFVAANPSVHSTSTAPERPLQAAKAAAGENAKRATLTLRRDSES